MATKEATQMCVDLLNGEIEGTQLGILINLNAKYHPNGKGCENSIE